MKVVSKLEIDDNRVLVILEDGSIGYTYKAFLKNNGKYETLPKIFLEPSINIAKVTTKELLELTRPEAITKYGKHVRTEKGNIINLIKFYEGL